MSRRRILPLALPLSLIAIGVILLNGGCPFIPQSPKTIGGPDVHGSVEGKLSDKPIRPGRVSREPVVALLGTASSDGGQTLAYTWTEQYGTWVGVCYPGWFGHPPYRLREMRINKMQFDEQDMLKDFDVEKTEQTS